MLVTTAVAASDSSNGSKYLGGPARDLRAVDGGLIFWIASQKEENGDTHTHSSTIAASLYVLSFTQIFFFIITHHISLDNVR